jgi:hypothetical protein
MMDLAFSNPCMELSFGYFLISNFIFRAMKNKPSIVRASSLSDKSNVASDLSWKKVAMPLVRALRYSSTPQVVRWLTMDEKRMLSL